MTTPPVPQALEVELPVPPGRRVRDAYGKDFEPRAIKHRAYFFDGRLERSAALFGNYPGTLYRTIRGVIPDDPDWPQPGLWFESMAEEMRETYADPPAVLGLADVEAAP